MEALLRGSNGETLKIGEAAMFTFKEKLLNVYNGETYTLMGVRNNDVILKPYASMFEYVVSAENIESFVKGE